MEKSDLSVKLNKSGSSETVSTQQHKQTSQLKRKKKKIETGTREFRQ
jgi:hypothetical protein